jgi:hypothetical protein
MKKLWMLLIVLALLVTAVPMFASDVTFSGRMIWNGGYDFDSTTTTANLARFRPTITAKIDDYNTLVSEFRAEGSYVFRPTDTTYPLFTGVRVYSAYVTTDVTGALGLNLPFTVKTTLGQWEPGFTDWNYVSESGWESYYDWPNKIADVGAFPSQFTGQVDLGFGPATLHVYSDFQGFMMFGLSGGYGPVVGWVTYQAPQGAFGDGILGVEAKYTGEFGDLKVGVPAFFRYQLNAPTGVQDYTFGVGVSGDYKIFHLAAGLEGDSDKIPDNVVFDASAKLMDALKVYGHVYLDVGKDSATVSGGVNNEVFAGADIGVSHMFGAANLMMGYVIGSSASAYADKVAIPINGDTFNVANGIYMAVDVSY